MKGYGTKTFGRLNAERYDAMYEDLMSAETLDSVETLAELAGGGRVLELAIGTGRVANDAVEAFRSAYRSSRQEMASVPQGKL